MAHIKLANGKTISVSSSFSDGIEILQDAITQDQTGGSYGEAWTLACAFVRSGVDWVGWDIYHARLREAYQQKLAGDYEYRYSVWNSEKERKEIMWSRHDTCRSLSKSHYIPHGVMLPNYVEGSPATPSLMRMTTVNRGLSGDVLEGWFLKSFASQQFHLLTSSDHDPLTWHAMKEFGLAVPSENITPEEGLRLLDINSLRAALNCFNLPKARSAAEARNIISEIVPKDQLRSYLIEKTLVRSHWKVLPPDGVSWDDFQSWRQQIKGMGEAVSDIFSGILKKGHPDYAELCC